jgi:hypothetical protein
MKHIQISSKMRSAALILSLVLFSHGSWAADSKSNTQYSNDSPKAACKSMVEAAKKGDFNELKGLSSGWDRVQHTAQEKSLKKGFEHMHQTQMDKLKDLKCGKEQVAEDHAIVIAESGEKERIVPFVKEGMGWKFDARTYMTFYRESLKEHGFVTPPGGAERKYS